MYMGKFYFIFNTDRVSSNSHKFFLMPAIVMHVPLMIIRVPFLEYSFWFGFNSLLLYFSCDGQNKYRDGEIVVFDSLYLIDKRSGSRRDV